MVNYEDKDFIGFSFNGTHSFDIGIVRTSNGSRYDENLLPQLQDKTVQVPGGDGTYYFGSQYTQRTIPVSIAFDSLSEKDFVDMQNWLNQREPKRLIFDERPYKYYLAKVNNSAQTLKYICFEEDGQRIYKGEGTLNFICYYPFAKSVHKYLDSYSATDYPNKAQWAVGSQMLETSGNYDKVEYKSGKVEVKLYNPGNLPTDWILNLSLNNVNQDTELTFKLTQNDGTIKTMLLRWGSTEGVPSKITINSKNNSIASFTNPGQLWTGILKEGDFFKIPLGVSTLTIESSKSTFSTTTCSNSAIDYGYLYF